MSVSIFDEAHIHYAVALNLIPQPNLRITTRALTENAVLRILNLPGYSSCGSAGFEAVRAQPAQLCEDLHHEFWPCDITLKDDLKIDWSRVMGHNQITDVYLLAFAVEHSGVLATLDHRVALSAVRGAEAKHLQLICCDSFALQVTKLRKASVITASCDF